MGGIIMCMFFSRIIYLIIRYCCSSKGAPEEGCNRENSVMWGRSRDILSKQNYLLATNGESDWIDYRITHVYDNLIGAWNQLDVNVGEKIELISKLHGYHD
mgnify:CR=1 FL=1